MMHETPILDSEVWQDLSDMLDLPDLRALAARALDEAGIALDHPLEEALSVIHKAAGGVAVLGAARLHGCLAMLESRLRAGDLADAAEAAIAARAALAVTRGTMHERLG